MPNQQINSLLPYTCPSFARNEYRSLTGLLSPWTLVPADICPCWHLSPRYLSLLIFVLLDTCPFWHLSPRHLSPVWSLALCCIVFCVVSSGYIRVLMYYVVKRPITLEGWILIPTSGETAGSWANILLQLEIQHSWAGAELELILNKHNFNHYKYRVLTHLKYRDIFSNIRTRVTCKFFSISEAAICVFMHL